MARQTTQDQSIQPAPPPYPEPFNSFHFLTYLKKNQLAAHITQKPAPPAAAAAPPPEGNKKPATARTLKTAFPLSFLNSYAAPVDCPVCGKRAVTRLEYVIGGGTHLFAITFLVSTVVLFWLPYVLRVMKNVNHHCGNPECGVLLATWHRAPSPGSIEVKEFS